MRNNLSHERFAKLLFEVQQQKTILQTELETGKTNILELAKRFNCSAGGIKSALKACGIPHGHSLKASKQTPIERDLAVVLKRLCDQLQVAAPELDKHLA